VTTPSFSSSCSSASLARDLGLGPAGDLLPPPLAVRAGLEADYATPAARTMPIGLKPVLTCTVSAAAAPFGAYSAQKPPARLARQIDGRACGALAT
jgi:hypothetical protein